MTSLHTVLAEHADEVRARAGIDGESLAVTYLTPRFATSRNVIGLASNSAGVTRLVAKIARDPDDASLAAEAHILDKVAELLPGEAEALGLGGYSPELEPVSARRA